MRRKKTKLKAFVLQNSTLDEIPVDISDAIKGRRSVGTFKNKRVSTEIIDKLVDAARRHF